MSNIDSETAEKKKKNRGDFEVWAWAPHFIMIWNITVRYKFWRLIFSRKPNMQVIVSLLVQKHESNDWQMCGIFEIWAQIDYKTID